MKSLLLVGLGLSACHLVFPYGAGGANGRDADRGVGDATAVAGEGALREGPASEAAATQDGAARDAVSDAAAKDQSALDAGVPALTTVFAKRYGGTDLDYSYAACVDGAGDLFLTGYFKTSIDFGGGALTSSGQNDVVLASIDAGGTQRLAAGFGGSGMDVGQGIAVDAAGNIYLTGYFAGAVSFGGATSLASKGGNDIFVASYTSSGAHRWSARYGSTGNDYGYKVAVDPAGAVYVVGMFSGTMDPGAISSKGSSDGFILALTSQGAYRWAGALGGTYYDHADGVQVDSQGNVYVTGSSWDAVDFGGGLLQGKGGDDLFLVSYTGSGVHRWSKVLGGTLADHGVGLAVDGKGNLAVTGDFRGTADFGGGLLTAKGMTDVVVASYDAAGSHRWSRSFGDAGQDGGYATTTDGAGNVYVTGELTGTVDAGGGPLTSAGGLDAFVASYTTTGTHRWSRRFGGPLSDRGTAVGVAASGSVWVTGFFSGTADFAGASLTSAGSWDIFVVKLKP